ncbi:putative DNA-binding transcriptional regulator YafY [Arthrobacter pigmenti]|uniref:Putative DNA-binding transcriptional regulator YafY n=1 Tax=Arthrobacter pigmenti TaxID=271432 RepID=A0A846RR13_9MICC|nr:YafY family protein [Arthrobacter pigmenti]NJC22844.1 putative DNA-binding transcriptional regulator YafY [Arthrobacter pigmenti]
MLETSARLLQLLSLLQLRREWTGAALADRMSVTERTVRRDIGKLRTLGYPISASPGIAGGYQLGAGAQLPPLLLDDDEALAVAIGLSAVTASPVSGLGEASVRALTKLEQVLPGRLRPKFAGLRTAVTRMAAASTPVNPEVLTALSSAITERRVVVFRYARHDGESSRRVVEPVRLVDTGRRWYLVAWDTGRQDWRTFRVDRCQSVPSPRERFPQRPLPAKDLAAYVQKSITRSPYRHDVVVRISAPLTEVGPMIPPNVAELEDSGGSTVMRFGADSLDWPLMHVVALGFEFQILEPQELKEHAVAAAERLTRAAVSDDRSQEGARPS